MAKSILVTGGAGYIGTHICIELLNNGYDIVVVDNFSNSHPEALRRVEAITGRTFKTYNADLNNKELLMEIFAKHNVDSVIHLAGLKSVYESTISPLLYYSCNLSGTFVLCEVMKYYNVKKLVFSSSATVYAPQDTQQPITEQHPLGPVNPYGRTKQMIEELLRDMSLSDPSWSISVLRYFNPVGAHESGLIGEDPRGVPNNLVPYMAQVTVGKLPTLFIYGNDYPTRDGTGIRDYIHVVDLAKGHLRALAMIQESQGINIYNLGTGHGYSVMEMKQAFEKASGVPIPYQVVGRRKGDVAFCYADVNRAKNQLGWTAEKSIEDMSCDAWRWQKQNPLGYVGSVSTKMETRGVST